MKSLYPEIEPHSIFFLKTGSPHEVYVEESGNPDGIPVIFLHGGPCSGTKPDHRRFFNPDNYRIILFDQRGCGFSKPFGELEANTTQHLCADMERIRQQLKISQWLLFGGSWGGTLALLYAQQFPKRVSGMILRGVFLARQQDLNWFIKDGVRLIYPEQWLRLFESVPERGENLVQSLYNAVTGDDEITQRRVAREWAAWNGQVALGNDFQPMTAGTHVTETMVKQARMELHYANHRYFIEENQILAGCKNISDISTVIIHGRKDLVCPIESAVRLYQALPGAEYIILPEAGHVAQGTQMIDALVSATDQFAARFVV
jgi:proline iminopeptidase